jgi:hypothetical protein
MMPDLAAIPQRIALAVMPQRTASCWKPFVGLAAAALLLGVGAARSQSIPIPERIPACAPDRNFAAADLAASLSGSSLEQIKKLKVNTVFRYYDHENETLPGKTLLGPESDAIVGAGLKIGVVFQHYNEDPAKFLSPDAGTKDAERALKLADINRQPYGSAIYFAVDGPERHLDPLIREYRLNRGNPLSDPRKALFRAQGRAPFIDSYADFLRYGRDAFHVSRLDTVTSEMMKPLIERYFHSVRDAFAAYAAAHAGKGYKIGMYCTGAMCLLGDDKKLAEYFWVSPEGRRDREYREFLQRDGHWSLVQQLSARCASVAPAPGGTGLQFDFDLVSAKHADFGQWSAKRPTQ